MCDSHCYLSFPGMATTCKSRKSRFGYRPITRVWSRQRDRPWRLDVPMKRHDNRLPSFACSGSLHPVTPLRVQDSGPITGDRFWARVWDGFLKWIRALPLQTIPTSMRCFSHDVSLFVVGSFRHFPADTAISYVLPSFDGRLMRPMREDGFPFSVLW